MKAMTKTIIAILSICTIAYAQPTRISDNSFLIEEAYNQERGVVQHILLLDKDFGTDELGLSFAQEWPLGGQTFQGAYTFSADREFNEVWLDLQLRYQVPSGDGVALAPSVMVSLPVKKAGEMDIADSERFTVGLPVSAEFSSKLSWHLNTSLAIASTQSVLHIVDVIATSFGNSFVYAISPTLDVMLEGTYATEMIESRQVQVRAESTEGILSPGVRHAWNLKSGAQVVAGFGLPIGLTDDVPDYSGIFYFSFEHGFLK